MATTQTPSPLATPPEGFRYVSNRTAAPYEQMYNGVPYVFAAHETRLLRSDVADFCVAHSIIPGTLRNTRGGLTAERALALGPGWTIAAWNRTSDTHGAGNDVYTAEYREAEADPLFQVPTDTVPGKTLFDLASTPNYTDRASKDGMPTHPQLIPV